MMKQANDNFGGVFFTALKGTILFLMFAAVVFAAPNPKDSSAYWRETGLTFARVTAELSNEHCRADFNQYVGCLEGARMLMKRLGLGLDIAHDVRAKTKLTVGGFDLVPAKTLRLLADSAVEKLELIRKQRQQTKNFWKVTYSLDRTADFARLWKWLGERVPKEAESEYAAALYNGYLLAAKDPAARLVPQALIDDENGRAEDEYTGIGVVVAALGDEIVIRRVTSGGPADQAGVRTLDTLLSVNGVGISGMSWDAIGQQFKAEEGTKIQLSVLRGRAEKKFTVTAAKLVKKKVETKWLGDREAKSAYGYIRLGDFSGLANCSDVDHAAKTFEKEGARGLVLDLRGNPGGRLGDALCIANVFLPERTHVFSVLPLPGHAGLDYLGVTAVAATTLLPMVTLVDSQSASASELLAGSLQDYARTLVLGDRSFGKGTVQAPGAWLDDKAITYFETSGLFYLPSGRVIQLAGVTPDLRPTYLSPKPHADEMLALRQEDLSINPVQPPPSPKRRPRDFSAVQECVDKGNAAKGNGGKNADFTIVSAQTALDCWQSDGSLRWEIISGSDL